MINTSTLKRKIKRKPIQWTRHSIQIVFSLFLLFVGWQFYQFYAHFESLGATPYVEKPPAVEGFLPIGSLVALKVWITTGEFDFIHPAGLILFTFFILSGFLFRKAFCGWLCPVGTVSEFLGMFGRKIMKKKINPPKWVRWILYSIKYLLLIVFLKAVIFDMSIPDSKDFLSSPYNKVADVKMMLFFLGLSAVAIKVLLVLALLGIFIQNFWCRYLCPYGALIGLGSLFRITKIKRNESTCIDCNQCTRVCPQGINVAKLKAVTTPECTSCFSCIEACPVKDTLNMTVANKKVNKWAVPTSFLVLFTVVIIVAKATGHWDSTITYEEFQELIPVVNYLSH